MSGITTQVNLLKGVSVSNSPNALHKNANESFFIRITSGEKPKATGEVSVADQGCSIDVGANFKVSFWDRLWNILTGSLDTQKRKACLEVIESGAKTEQLQNVIFGDTTKIVDVEVDVDKSKDLASKLAAFEVIFSDKFGKSSMEEKVKACDAMKTVLLELDERSDVAEKYFTQLYTRLNSPGHHPSEDEKALARRVAELQNIAVSPEAARAKRQDALDLHRHDQGKDFISDELGGEPPDQWIDDDL